MKGLNEIYDLMSKLCGEIITESVLMEATRDEIYAQYYDERNGRVKKIPREEFDKICNLGDVDNNPNKMSEFSKWLCDIYGTPKWKRSVLSPVAFDWLRNAFITFRKIQKIKPEGIDLNLRNYDVGTFLERMKYVRDNGLDMSKADIKKLGSETVYEDNTWKVVLIKSRDASLFYGRGTTWCTSSTDSAHYFNDYMKRGLLFIFINLKDKHKYQGFYDFDFNWYEMKDEENDTIDETEVFPESLFQQITEKARELTNRRAETVWENESEICGEKQINEYFDVYIVKRLDRFRVKNKKTGEFIQTVYGSTFSDVRYYKQYGVLFLEFDYGMKNSVCIVNNDKIMIFELSIKSYFEVTKNTWGANSEWYHNEESGCQYFIFSFGVSKFKVLDARTHTYLSINGKEEFQRVYQIGDILVIFLYNYNRVFYSLKTNKCIDIDGEYNITYVSEKGNNIIYLETKKGSYIFNAKFNTYFPYNGDKEIKLQNDYLVVNIKDDNDPAYKIYNVNNGNFLSVDGIDTFEGYEKMYYGNLYALFIYSQPPKIWLYNTIFDKFCDSDNVPMSDSDIEAFYGNTVLFWGDNDILACYDVEKNEIITFPIAIKREDIYDIENDNMRKEKHAQAIVLKNKKDDNETVIYLDERYRMIMYLSPENGERKIEKF